jgi:PilZ domain
VSDLSKQDRRAHSRVSVELPIRLNSGYDRVQTPQATLATITDASLSGLGLLVDHPLAVGQIVRLELPAPLPRAGPFLLGGRSVRAYGVVRNVRERRSGDHRVGVKFFDFVEFQDARPPERRDERRRFPRYAIPVHFVVEQASPKRAALSVAEDLSRGGAQLSICLSLKKGDVVRLSQTEGGFETRAQVTHVATRPDGLVRLHVKFLDGKVPAHVVPLVG